MAQTLFDGHKYTFNKVSGSLILLDSTDNSHETIIFREGIQVSGSCIDIKPSTTDKGITGYAVSTDPDKTFELRSSYDDGYINLYSNGVKSFGANHSLFETRVLNNRIGHEVGTADSPYSSGGYVNLELGRNRGDDGGAYIDLIADTYYTDYGLRIIKESGGQNSNSDIIHRGTGQFRLKNTENGNMKFQIGNAYQYFYADAPSKHCFSFHNDGNNNNRYLFSWAAGKDDGTGTNYYVYARNGSGSGSIGSIRGVGGTFAIYAFTGVHDAKILQSDSKTANIIETGASDNNHYPLGTILVNVKSEIVTLNDNGDPSMQPESYIVSSSLHQDKRAFGVYFGNANDEERPHYESVAAIGDGAILVCSQNGNIENGDYITTASGSGGYGCKQNDDILHNYTVAKSLEDVDWSTEPSSSKLIACTYHCG